MSRQAGSVVGNVRTGATLCAATIGFILAGCAGSEGVSTVSTTSTKGSLVAEDWGTVNGQSVQLFTLTNEHGLVAKITNYGAILTEMHVPDRDGGSGDVVLGFESLERYLEGHPFFGAMAGRVANRIADGRFELDGETYELATNNEPNHLHGGEVGFDKKVWEAEPMETDEGPAVKLTYVSPDGEEGYPGTVTATVTYTLTHENELKVEMRATTDAATPVNLAHHTYWNLGGHASGDALDHVLELHADHYTPTDNTLIPTGEIAPVEGTPFDFTEPKPIGADIDQLQAQEDAGHGGGYDLNFVVRGEIGQLRPVARVVHPDTGRVMEIHSTQPGVQLYTGNWLDESGGKGGARYDRYGGFCLETQHYPDSINKPEFPSVVLRPGETYHHVMVHRFSAE